MTKNKPVMSFLLGLLAVWLLASTFLTITLATSNPDAAMSLLENRRGLLVAEIVVGVAGDENEHGWRDGKDTDGFYIAYDTNKVDKGDKVYTLLTYNPLTNYTDDFTRFDMWKIKGE